MDVNRLASIQSDRGAGVGTVEPTGKTNIDAYINKCRDFIQTNTDAYRNLDAAPKREKIKGLIQSFVMNNQNDSIEDYMSKDNKLDTNKLIDKLSSEILDYGILTQAMEDPDVFEIRGNGKEIKIEKNGRIQDLTDDAGNILSFENTEQQDIIMRKLLGDTRLTPAEALVNSRTVEGYRIAAVHSSATSPDPSDPTAPQYNAFVLRKFKKSKMGLPEIVRFKTLSDNMARLMSLLPKGGLTWFTVGPTASGKTTTNNAILQEVPPTTRTVLVQNPSEIDLRFKDAKGRVYNDVLHLEGRDIENPSPTDATMQNIMTHVLRLSPTFVCFGELRTNAEFKLAMQIMQAGHPVNSTFHAETSDGAIRRFLTAYLAESGNEPSDLALMTLTSLVRIIVVQKILRDGTRQIIQISEVVDVEEDNPNKAKINDLYKFVITNTDYDAQGQVKSINGYHKRVGKLSERIIDKLKLEGCNESQYDFLINDPTPDEQETYTGENINGYGMKKGA